MVKANEGMGLRFGGALARGAQPTPNPTRNPEKRREDAVMRDRRKAANAEVASHAGPPASTAEK